MDTNVGKPLGDRVLLKMLERGEKTSSSGLIIRSSADSVRKAQVIAVSDGYFINTGNFVKLSVNVDDIVLVPNGINSTKLKFGDETYDLVRESDILMVT
jgi:chaperonin GroES